MEPVVEFNLSEKPIDADEYQELLAFLDKHNASLAKEARQCSDLPLLLRTLYDDMQRVKAGRAPRYTPLTGYPDPVWYSIIDAMKRS